MHEQENVQEEQCLNWKHPRKCFERNLYRKVGNWKFKGMQTFIMPKEIVCERMSKIYQRIKQ